jgi:hypothetical protein
MPGPHQASHPSEMALGTHREVAEAQAAYLLAQRFPRDEARALEAIRVAFQRPTLAERATYEYSKAGTAISGPSASAAAAMARAWGNLASGWRELGRGIGATGVPYSDVVAHAEDLQTRRRCTIGFVVEHLIDTRDGARACRDEREVYELTANLAARRVRACVLQLLPEDVVDAAMEQAATTIKARADTSPEGVGKMVAAFVEVGVSRTMIERRLQRPLASITAGQVLGLRRIYASLRDGVAVINDFFSADDSAPPASAPPPSAPVDPTTGEIDPTPPPARRARPPRAAKPVDLSRDDPAGESGPTADELLAEVAHETDPKALLGLIDVTRSLPLEERGRVLDAINVRGAALLAEKNPGTKNPPGPIEVDCNEPLECAPNPGPTP